MSWDVEWLLRCSWPQMSLPCRRYFVPSNECLSDSGSKWETHNSAWEEGHIYRAVTGQTTGRWFFVGGTQHLRLSKILDLKPLSESTIHIQCSPISKWAPLCLQVPRIRPHVFFFISRRWDIVGWRTQRKTEVLFHCISAHHKSHVQWTGIKPGPPRWKSGNLQPEPWHGETQILKERDIRWRDVVRDIIIIIIIIIIINFVVSHCTPCIESEHFGWIWPNLAINLHHITHPVRTVQ